MNKAKIDAIAKVLYKAKLPLRRIEIEKKSKADEDTIIDYLLILNRNGLAQSISGAWEFTRDGRTAFANREQGIVP